MMRNVGLSGHMFGWDEFMFMIEEFMLFSSVAKWSTKEVLYLPATCVYMYIYIRCMCIYYIYTHNVCLCVCL